MYKSRKDANFKYFILIMIVPIIGILSIFSMAYVYVQDEINIIEHEIKGLHRANQLQNIIFDMQKLRGLANINIKTKKCNNDIKNIKQNIIKDLNKLQNELKSINKTSPIKLKLLKYSDEVIKHLKHNIEFGHLSHLIQESILILEHIAHHSKLILDAKLQSYVLVETVISILPELIEYNGQIRGISSSIINSLTEDNRHNILTQLSKIDDRLDKLNFNMSQLNSAKNNIVNTIYKNMLSAQNSLINFTKEEILYRDKVMLKSNDIFRLNSNNIEFIALLYKINSKELHNILTLRIQDKNIILFFIFFTGLASIAFIIYINNKFFNKNKEFIKQIELLSITDSMTTLFNRRYFDIIFDKQLKIQQRAKRNLIFIMMDIDHFKQYNDTYGHQEGDNALIAVAKSLKNNLKRPDDLAFRLGGEEFGILCNGMDEKKAYKFAQNIRENIQKLKIEHKGNSANKFLTVSIGLVVIEADLKCEMNSIYKCADEALYTSKLNGRNQVCMSDIKHIISTT